MVQRVLLKPEPLVGHLGISVDKELAVRVIDLTLYHPRLDHGQDGSADFFENLIDESARRWITIQRESVDGAADRATLQVLRRVDDER